MKRIAWTEQARSDVRALEKPTAMRILSALDRLVRTGAGDVTTLQGGEEELRLRMGDYRLFFVATGDDAVDVRRVRHRREAYR